MDLLTVSDHARLGFDYHTMSVLIVDPNIVNLLHPNIIAVLDLILNGYRWLSLEAFLSASGILKA